MLTSEQLWELTIREARSELETIKALSEKQKEIIAEQRKTITLLQSDSERKVFKTKIKELNIKISELEIEIKKYKSNALFISDIKPSLEYEQMKTDLELYKAKVIDSHNLYLINKELSRENRKLKQKLRE